MAFLQPLTPSQSGCGDDENVAVYAMAGVEAREKEFAEQLETVMIISSPLIRLVLHAISACGLMDPKRELAGNRSNRIEQSDSPFVLVACAPDGRWGVFQQDFDKPRASFDELQKACDYANELARTRTDAMVLIRKKPDSVANPDSSLAAGTM